MLRPKVTSLPGHIQSIYIQNIAKLYARLLTSVEATNDLTTAKELSDLVSESLALFNQSADLEVQERVKYAILHSLRYFICTVLHFFLCIEFNNLTNYLLINNITGNIDL